MNEKLWLWLRFMMRMVISVLPQKAISLFSKKHFLRMAIMPEEDIEAMASAISG